MTDRIHPRDPSLASRVTVGALLAPAVLWLFWCGGYPFFAFLALLVLAGQAELFRMRGEGMPLLHRVVAHAAGFAILLDGFSVTSFFHTSGYTGVIVIAALLGFFFAELLRAEPEGSIGRVTWSLFATLYPAGFLAFLPRMASYPAPLMEAGNRLLPLFVLMVIWVFDIASYFAGTRFGRRPLLPAVSPKKTWEGLMGGLAGALAAGFAVSFIPGVTLVHALAAALIASLAGLAGDFSESLIKRDLGVKDSSRILAGHGGVLDRFDSLFFAAPAVYGYLLVVSAVRGCR